MRGLRKINCRQAYRLLHERLSGTLPAEKEARLDEHLARCAACAQRARTLEKVIGRLRRTPAPTPPPALSARLHAAAQQSYREGLTPVRRWRPAPALAAAALVAVAVLAVTLWPRTTLQPTPEPPGEAVIAHQIPPPALTKPAAATTTVPGVNPAPESRPQMVSTHRIRRSPRPRIVPAITRGPQAAALSPQVARAALAMSVDNMAPDTRRAAGPGRLTQAQFRVAQLPRGEAQSPAPTPPAVSDAFADEVVGGLIANAMLTSYLDGAPPGLQAQPAVLEGEGG